MPRGRSARYVLCAGLAGRCWFLTGLVGGGRVVHCFVCLTELFLFSLFCFTARTGSRTFQRSALVLIEERKRENEE